MDAIDILGGMLGHKSSGSGMGAEILKDILGGKPAAKRAPAPSPRSAPSTPSGPVDIHDEARELEDLLNVAHKRHTGRATGPTQQVPQYQAPSRPRAEVGSGSVFPERQASQPSFEQRDPTRQNEQALVLIRAMVNAAKSDGQIGPGEQQEILENVGGRSRKAVDFLRKEFTKPLDVREFAWSVPLGMEQHVYAMSLTAIDLDTNPEAKYLRELAHGLRIPPHVCDQIHQRFGAPCIFQNAGKQ
jgi:hypothetical protein